jgi:hypothetical protein
MPSERSGNETKAIDSRENSVSRYPQWVKDLIDRQLDAAIDRYTRSASDCKGDDIKPVKPKPR